VRPSACAGHKVAHYLDPETGRLLYALIIIVALSAVTVLQRILFIRAALATTRRRA
jgi:hypothetical protein